MPTQRHDQPPALPDAPLSTWPARIWALLQQATESPGDPLRTPGLATSSLAGPVVRTVVLRAARPEARILLAYTDLRSAKVGQLRRQPRAAWLFYDAARALQIRIHGTVCLHAGNALAEECWNALSEGSRRNYLSLPGPGEALPARETGVRRNSETVESAQAQANFAVLSCQAWTMDCLCLSEQGNTRASFHWESSAWHGRWLCP